MYGVPETRVKTAGAVAAIGAALAPLADRMVVAFVFGSVARGEENRSSDIDLMVIGNASFAEVSSAVVGAEQALRREINLVVYPVREFQAKARQGHSFVARVIGGGKLFVGGSARELDALLEEPVDS